MPRFLLVLLKRLYRCPHLAEQKNWLLQRVNSKYIRTIDLGEAKPNAWDAFNRSVLLAFISQTGEVDITGTLHMDMKGYRGVSESYR